MFGLHNYRGSCWVNAALQAYFRCPEVQTRYKLKEHDKENVVDVCLNTIWSSKGEHGLRDFFEAVRTDTMPAGLDIGDSHELFTYLCDKLTFLDELCRFKIAHSIECIHCKHRSITHDTVIEFPFDSVNVGKHIPLSTCISKTVEAYQVDEWLCEECKQKGGMRQQLIASFPKYMVFHAPLGRSTIDYSSLLLLNKRKYALSSVVCFNGSHWWTYGRDMPPGSPWVTFDDVHITNNGPKQFPVSPHMRMLIYYRLDE